MNQFNKLFKGIAVFTLLMFASTTYAQTSDFAQQIGSTYPLNGLGSGNTPAFSTSIFNDSIQLDSSGNTYVLDGGSSTSMVHKYDSYGDYVQTISLSGSTYSSKSLRMDSSGNFYIVAPMYNGNGYTNNKIMRFSSAGTLTLTIGGGVAGTSTGSNLLSGTSALFNNSDSVAVKSDGSVIYIADKTNNLLKQYSNTGAYLASTAITSPSYVNVRGNNLFVYSNVATASNSLKVYSISAGFGAPLYSIAQASSMYDIGVDSDGTYIYVTRGEGGNNILRYFLSNGTLLLTSTYGSSIYSKGNYVYNSLVYTVDSNTKRVRVYNAGTTTLSDVSTTAYVSKYGNNYLNGTSAQLGYTSSVNVDSDKNVYITDSKNIIRKYSSDGTFVSSGSYTLGIANGVQAVGEDGMLYAIDIPGNRIQRINPNSGYSTTVVLGSVAGTNGDNNLNGTSALLWNPRSIKIRNGKAYVADYGNKKVKVYDATNWNWITTIGSGVLGDNNLNGTSAQLYYPMGVTGDALGNIYVSLLMKNMIKVYDSNGTWLYNIGSPVYTSGENTLNGSSALLNAPRDVQTDALNNLWVADYGNNRVVKYANGNFVSRIGSFGVQYDNQLGGASAGIKSAYGIDVDNLGDVYVADNGYFKMKKYSGGYVASCATSNLTNVSLVTGTPTVLNQARVKDALSCGYSCINGYTGNSCEIAPAPVCNTTPSYTNAVFSTGSATTYLQDWVKDAPNCGFTCSNGYTGSTCEIAPQCDTPPVIVNAVFSTGSATSYNQTWVKDSNTCGFTCINGYTGNSCEIAPPSCAVQPNYTHTTFTVGTPESVNQAWSKTGSSCSFSCVDGYTGDSCEIAPFCTSQPDIANAVFGNTNAETANQNWVKDAPSCGYTCNTGFGGNLCEPIVVIETKPVKLDFIKNKGFNINVKGTANENKTYTSSGYVDITVSNGTVNTGSPQELAIATAEEAKVEKVLNLVESNKDAIVKKTSGFGMFTNSADKTAILTMSDTTYNKYGFLIDFLESKADSSSVSVGSDAYTKFIDTENGIVIFYKIAN